MKLENDTVKSEFIKLAEAEYDSRNLWNRTNNLRI
jgi:hypothetical protein